MAQKPIRIFSLMLMFFLVFGCSDPIDGEIEFLQTKTTQSLATLSKKLDDGEVRNAMLLKEYATLMIAQRPELDTLLNHLAKDGTSEGAMFRGLRDRVSVAAVDSNFMSKEEQLEELKNLEQALDPVLFNDALSDPLNVVADMSSGKLARVNAISQERSGEDFGAGSQLVGNPNYGNWVGGSGGSSFWQWYGMYAMFSNLSNPISYDRWGRHRRYSYYNDYGRYRYSSPKQRRSQSKVWQSTKKSFSTGQRYNSPYSTSRSGSSGLSRKSSQAKSAAGKGFRTTSSYSKSSYSKSNTSSSFRNSRSSTSRGVSRGK